MSTETPAASPELFRALVDDAAVFPPGQAPVDAAVRQHAAWRSSSVSTLLGPLLVPAGAAEEVVAALDAIDGDVPLGVIGRPGTPLADVASALTRLREAGADVRSVEIAHADGWQAALDWGLPLAVELPRAAADRDAALAELGAARADGHEVIAKMRTQATADAPVPAADDLAAFIVACVQARVPFKLTGGLHHAIATTAESTTGSGEPEEQHGCLNALIATDRALDGEITDVTAVLLSRDEAQLVADAGDLNDQRAERVRSAFVSLGCCGVLDPLGELAALGLVDRRLVDGTPIV